MWREGETEVMGLFEKVNGKDVIKISTLIARSLCERKGRRREPTILF